MAHEGGWQANRIRAPHLVGDDWLNVAQPLTMDELVAGGPVLVDFWESSCVNCIRTLPYLVAWHERYAPWGLTIVGIHSPEFAFGRERETVAAAIHRFALPYPVLMDPAHRNWDAFANRAWPTKYLIDSQRIIRFMARGEGRYGETESAIQTLLREAHGEALPLPPPLEPLRPTDVPGAVCYRTTPELYAGYAQGRFGGDEPQALSTPQAFPSQAERAEGLLYLEGAWRVEPEWAEAAGQESRLHVPYRAAEFNAVLASASGEPLRVYLLHDGQSLRLDEMGEDVVVDGELGSYVTVRGPRLYNLVINLDFALHEITLAPAAPDLRVYAFSFASCTKPTQEPGDWVVP